MATRENPRRHLILLIALLTLIVFGPLLSVSRHGTMLLNVVGAAVLLTRLFAVSECKSVFITGIILSFLSIIATFLLIGYPVHAMVIIAHATMILVLGFFAVAILDYVVRSGRVTSDKIFAAICAYLLMVMPGRLLTRFSMNAIQARLSRRLR